MGSLAKSIVGYSGRQVLRRAGVPRIIAHNVRPAVGRTLEGRESNAGEKRMLKTRLANHELFKTWFRH